MRTDESGPRQGRLLLAPLWARVDAGLVQDALDGIRAGIEPQLFQLARDPLVIALVNGASLHAVHRTYLRPDGSGKAEINQPKLMLGSTAGGAVRLTDGSGPLVVAEGIETALSLASGLLRLPATVWAALSTSGLRGLHLPDRTGRLTIASDGDAAGREAAQALAARAHSLGWQVSLLPAPDGRDWNDILVMKGETK